MSVVLVDLASMEVALPTNFHPRERSIDVVLQQGMDGLMKLASELPDTPAGKGMKSKIGAKMDTMLKVKTKLSTFKGFIIGFERSFVDEMGKARKFAGQFESGKTPKVLKVKARTTLKKFQDLLKSVNEQLNKLSPESAAGVVSSLASTTQDLAVVVEEEESFFKGIMDLMPAAGAAKGQLDENMIKLREENKTILETMRTDMASQKTSLGSTNGELAAIVGRIVFLRDKLNGKQKSVAEIEKMASEVSRNSKDEQERAAKSYKTETVSIFGITLRSWEVDSPGAKATAAEYRKLESEYTANAAKAADIEKTLAKDLEDAQRTRSELEQTKANIETAIEHIQGDLESKAREVQAHGEALAKIAEDFPGMHPQAVVDLHAMFDNLPTLIGDASRGSGFVEMAVQHLMYMKKELEGVIGLLNEGLEDDEVLESLGDLLDEALLEEKYLLKDQ